MEILKIYPNADHYESNPPPNDNNSYGCHTTEATFWAAVDEEIADGDITRIWGDYDSDGRRIFDFTNHTIENGTIAKIIIHLTVKFKWLSESGSIQSRLNGTYATIFHDAGDEVYREHIFEYLVNPVTGLDWTWADIDNINAGAEIDSGPEYLGVVTITQYYIEVFYTPASPPIKRQMSFNQFQRNSIRINS